MSCAATAVGCDDDGGPSDDGSIDLTVTSPGAGGLTYSWSNGATTEDISGLAAGTYTVTVTDENGCTATCSATVEAAIPLTVSCAPTPVTCDDDSGPSNDGAVNLTVTSAGAGDLTYAWSNGATTEDISGLAAGTYTVTVTDANGCTASCSATVEAAIPLQVLCAATPVSCDDDAGPSNDGTVALTVTSPGAGGLVYAWSNGATTEDISGLAAGTYTVTVTDANGCTVSCSATVDPASKLTCDATEVSPVSCHGGADGVATVTPTGNVGLTTYQWSDPSSQTTQTATGLAAGSYTVLVTDSKGCTTACSVVVTEPPLLECSTSKTDVSCNGGDDGSATVAAVGGVAPYDFSWSDGQTGATASGLAADTYTVTVIDANGCTTTCTVEIEEPALLTCVIAADSEVDCGDSMAGVSPSGGTPPYNYAWEFIAGDWAVAAPADQSSVTFAKGSTCTATIQVTVTDDNGCTTTCTADFADTTPPEIVGPADAFVVGCGPGADCDVDPTNTGEPEAMDTCGDVTGNAMMYEDLVSGDCPKEITRIWTVTDSCGNEAVYSQTIVCLPPGAMTSSSLCTFDKNSKDGSQFNLIFTPDAQIWPAFKITSTNPGQFLYNVFFEGEPGDTVEFSIDVPYPFVTQGSNPVELYEATTFETLEDGEICYEPLGDSIGVRPDTIALDDYASMTNTSTLVCDADSCTLKVSTTVPDSGFLHASVHLDYGLKGPQLDVNPADGLPDRYDQGLCSTNLDGSSAGCDALFDETSEPETGVAIATCSDYLFSHRDDVASTPFDTTLQNVNNFKRFVGCIASAQLTPSEEPISGLEFQIVRDSTGAIVASAETDEDGIASLPYFHKGRQALFWVLVPELGVAETFELRARGFATVRLLVADDGTPSVEIDSVTIGNGGG